MLQEFINIPAPKLIPGNKVEISNTLTWQDNIYPISYSFSSGPINNGLEPWVALSLLTAMKCGVDLQLEEPVSDRFLQNIQAIQTIFNYWDSEHKRSEYLAHPLQIMLARTTTSVISGQ